MIDCDTIREWLPWYVSGRLAPGRLERMSAHIAACDACQAELAEMIALRNAYAAEMEQHDVPIGRVWNRLSGTLGDQPSAQIDLGSFLVGLQIGIASRGRGAIVNGRINVLGHTARILGKRKKGA